MHLRPALARVLCLAALLATALVIPSAARAADIVIANHGFEEGTSSLTGWTQSHGTTGVSPSTERAWRGARSARLTDGSTDAAVGLQSGQVPVTAGKTYAAFAKVYLAAGRADLYLRFWNGATLVHSAYTQVAAPLNQWSDVRVVAAAPAGVTRASVLLYSGVGGTGTSFWDEILFTAQVTDLGVQVENSAPNGTTFGVGPDQDKIYAIYTGTQNDTPQLAVIDADTENAVQRVPIPGATGGWAATTATDGTVYLGTYSNAGVYRHTPGSGTVSLVGEAAGTASFVWCLTPGRDGKVYGGTYDTGAFFKYEPGDSALTPIGSTPIQAGKKYVRSIAYDTAANVTYLGTGTSAALVRFDNTSGAKADLLQSLPARLRAGSMVTTLKLTGGRLFARIDTTLIVLSMSGATPTLEAEITGTSADLSDERDGKVYYAKGSALYAYDIASRTEHAVGVDLGMDPTAFGWVKLAGDADHTLVALGAAANRTRLFKYRPADGVTRSVEVAGTPVLPAAINAIAGGPDGKIYSGAFFTGGMGVHDPMRGDDDDLRADLMHRAGFSQTDSMLNHQGRLYVATYPGAKVYEYDPASPWDFGANPRLLFALAGDHQSRPYALAGAPDGRIFVGTVPDYGRYDGALTIYDPATGSVTVHRNIVPDQSVVTLAYHGGLVYGGTSTRGALGTGDPLAEAAVLFVHDPATGETVPKRLPGAAADATTITDLTVVDGRIWGFAEGYLFVFDPAVGDFVYHAKKFSDVGTEKWRDADLRTVAKDPAHVYGTAGDHLFKITRSTYAVTELIPKTPGLDGLATDDLGNLYYKIVGRLYRYAF
ncbi:hypothetical protein [Nonomuraea sp. bgisy101]|uniref:hypothetical protein n=1 Tax=Nonomuraea sp. bgisy101 TaxID=3413784 RepID=UPI003D731934